MSSKFSPQTFSPCRNQYKCGAFFMDLQGQNETLRWIGALPDMLHKDTVKSSPKLRAQFGRLHKKSFRTIPGFCNDVYANTKCYAMVSQGIVG